MLFFKPQQGRQNLTVDAKLERGKVGDAAVSLLTVKAAIRDALGRVPGVDASVHGETITAGDVEITPVDLTLKGPLNALAVSGSLAGTAPDGKPLAGEWAAKVDVLKVPISATVSTLIARYAKGRGAVDGAAKADLWQRPHPDGWVGAGGAGWFYLW